MSNTIIHDLDDILNEEIIKNQNNDGSLKLSFEFKDIILKIIKKYWLFITILFIGNISLIILYKKLFKN